MKIEGLNKGELLLPALTAGNLLAFLAALGTLRAVTFHSPQTNPRMRWTPHGGAFRPVLNFKDATPGLLLDILDAVLPEMAKNPAIHYADNPAVDPPLFEKQEMLALDTALRNDRHHADFLAALGTSAARDPKSGIIEDTAFRTMQGAGHQNFLETMRELATATTRSHLDESLFGRFDATEKSLGLRWDAAEDRPYALRWRNPSSETVWTVRGANRLAFEALPFFPVLSHHGRARTTGFGAGSNPTFTYPVWAAPANVDMLRSMLALPDLQKAKIGDRREMLAGMGIVAVYRCERVTRGKYRNFSAPYPV
jgi:hypothetical protein